MSQEFPQEPPVLPQGETNLPSALSWSDPSYVRPSPERMAEAVEQSREEAKQRWEALCQAPDAAHLREIRELPIQYQELVLHFWPHVYGKPSSHDSKPIVTLQQVLHEALVLKKQQTAEPPVVKEQSAYAKAHMDWIAECAARKQWIQAHKTEWERRKEEHRVAMLQWEQYVNEARTAYMNAKAYPAPARPEKQ